MGVDEPHIRLKLDTDQPVALEAFVAEFVGIGSQFEKFLTVHHAELRAETRFYIKEVRSGCIEADLVTRIVAGAVTLYGVARGGAEAIEKGRVLVEFVGDLKQRISPYFRKGGRTPDASKSDLTDFLKTTQAIANDPNGAVSLEAALFEDGERKVRAAFRFTTNEARQAEIEIGEHRRELEARTDETQERVLLQFVRPSVEAGKPGKKGGERGVIASIHKRAMPIFYASGLAEERMLHEKMQLEGNVFRALFDVSVNVELSATGKPVAYRITEVHSVVPDGLDDDLLDG